jgi:hypothetical protein
MCLGSVGSDQGHHATRTRIAALKGRSGAVSSVVKGHVQKPEINGEIHRPRETGPKHLHLPAWWHLTQQTALPVRMQAWLWRNCS